MFDGPSQAVKVAPKPHIGVVIVTYNSSAVIGACLDSLFGSVGVDMTIVISDNRSVDATGNTVKEKVLATSWTYYDSDEDPCTDSFASVGREVVLLRNRENGGYGYGVNAGLRFLESIDVVDFYWILNPDCEVLLDTARKFSDSARENPDFGLIGGRLLYLSDRSTIQTDGGTCGYWTGVCRNLNQGRLLEDEPKVDSNDIDFIPGASIFVSRAYLSNVGFLREDFFLFYEEVEWCTRDSRLSRLVLPDAIVFHHGGVSTGSGRPGVSASAFTNYYNFRGRSMYLLQKRPHVFPFAYSYSLLLIIRMLFRNEFRSAYAAFSGLSLAAPPKFISKVD